LLRRLLLLLPASISSLLALLLLLLMLLLLLCEPPLLVQLLLCAPNGPRAQHSFNEGAHSILTIFLLRLLWLLLLLVSMCRALSTVFQPVLLFMVLTNSLLVNFGRWHCCCDFCCSAAVAEHG
jgi:hypothetical protein